jgi:hypothetical protein
MKRNFSKIYSGTCMILKGYLGLKLLTCRVGTLDMQYIQQKIDEAIIQNLFKGLFSSF